MLRYAEKWWYQSSLFSLTYTYKSETPTDWIERLFSVYLNYSSNPKQITFTRHSCWVECLALVMYYRLNVVLNYNKLVECPFDLFRWQLKLGMCVFVWLFMHHFAGCYMYKLSAFPWVNVWGINNGTKL